MRMKRFWKSEALCYIIEGNAVGKLICAQLNTRNYIHVNEYTIENTKLYKHK